MEKGDISATPSPAQAGVPEIGAIFYDNNQEVGQSSTNTEVTLS
jgi:hypothetical protein